MSDNLDPTADFLARERAVLGEEADLFQASNSSTPAVTSPWGEETIKKTEETLDVSMLSIGPQQQEEENDNKMEEDINTETVIPKEDEKPSEFVQEWQTKQREIVETRDKQSEERHQQMVKEAQQQIDDFYEEYNERKDKQIEENRANQEIEIQAANKGNLWERAMKQIDLATKAANSGGQKQEEPKKHTSPFGGAANNNKVEESAVVTRDTSRMRELLQDLRRDKEAPGVAAAAAAPIKA